MPGRVAPNLVALVALVALLALLALLATVLLPLSPVFGARAAQPDHRDPPDHLKIVVSIAPLKGLVVPLLPEGALVEVLVPPGVSEHGYEIPAHKLAALAQADLVITVGMGLEPQVSAFLKANPRSGRSHVEFAAVVAADVKAASASTPEQHAGQEHRTADSHAHAADPHLWLDPRLAAKLVPALTAAIKQARDARNLQEPSDIALAAALQKWSGQIADLDAAYTRRLNTCPTKTFVAAHEAYGWLARRYGLHCVALSGLSAGEPTPRTIADAVGVIKAQQVKAVFFEPQISPAAGKRLAKATGVTLLMLDPVGDGDYLAMMMRNLDALVQGLGGPTEIDAEKTPVPASAIPSTSSPTKRNK